MKKGSKACFFLLVFSFLVLALMIPSESAGTKEKIMIVKEPRSLKWSESAQTFVLPCRDLNVDGKKEKIQLSVLMGGSANLDTIKVFDLGGHLIFKADYSSDDGCAIGQIISGPKAQIAIWRMIWGEHESHAAPHFYEVTLYDWSKQGKLVATDVYRTKQRCQSGSAAWQEFLRSQTHKSTNVSLKIESVSAKDIEVIRRLGLKETPKRTRIITKTIRKVGSWVILYRTQPPSDDWNGEWELWQKKGAIWKNKAIFGGPDGDEEWSKQMGMPVQVWRKLWDGQKLD